MAIRTVCRMNEGVARGHVDLARKLESLPVVAESFGRGDISRAHAQVITRANTPKRAEALAAFEQVSSMVRNG